MARLGRGFPAKPVVRRAVVQTGTLKTVNGLAIGSIKTIQTLAKASVKTYDGLKP